MHRKAEEEKYSDEHVKDGTFSVGSKVEGALAQQAGRASTSLSECTPPRSDDGGGADIPLAPPQQKDHQQQQQQQPEQPKAVQEKAEPVLNPLPSLPTPTASDVALVRPSPPGNSPLRQPPTRHCSRLTNDGDSDWDQCSNEDLEGPSE